MENRTEDPPHPPPHPRNYFGTCLKGELKFKLFSSLAQRKYPLKPSLASSGFSVAETCK